MYTLGSYLNNQVFQHMYAFNLRSFSCNYNWLKQRKQSGNDSIRTAAENVTFGGFIAKYCMDIMDI